MLDSRKNTEAGTHVAQDLAHGTSVLPVRPKVVAATADAIVEERCLGAALEHLMVHLSADHP